MGNKEIVAKYEEVLKDYMKDNFTKLSPDELAAFDAAVRSLNTASKNFKEDCEKRDEDMKKEIFEHLSAICCKIEELNDLVNELANVYDVIVNFYELNETNSEEPTPVNINAYGVVSSKGVMEYLIKRKNEKVKND